MVQPARAASVLPIRTALVVDPDHDTRDLYSLMLSGVADAVELVDDGRIALAKALATPPDLVVTETHVPFLDGYALCRLLRTDQATASIPIVVATSEGTVSSVQRARAAGASAVLLKPFTIDPFIATIREVLEAEPQPLATAPAGPSKELLERAARIGSRMKARMHQRYMTVTPPLTPPPLICPNCERPLVYVNSQIGGVNANQPEQWDRFDCAAGCGAFHYRHRTRQLRRLV
jgi:two-component system chemotaxis response regulator CheY